MKKRHFRQLYQLTLPILITQLTMFSTHLVDTLMTGRVHPRELAGVAIGTSIWNPILMIIMGIIMAVTPFVANYFGAKKKHEIPPLVQQAFYLSAFLSVLVFLLLGRSDTILNWMKIEPEIMPIASGYLHAISFGVPALLGYNVLKSYSEGVGLTRPAMFTGFLSLPLNIFLNYVLIFGHFGFPAMGGVGAGWATAITFWIMFVIMFLFSRKSREYQPYSIYGERHPLSVARIWEIVRLGVPIGLTLFIEGSIFATITLLMNAFGSNVVAAHQIAINFASFTFMVPMSLAMGLTVAVGQSVGAKKWEDARSFVWVGLLSAGMFMAFSAFIMLTFAEWIVLMYTKDLHVQNLAIGFLMLAALFQISDGINVSSQGAMRGLKDTNVSLVFNIIAYWFISLPVGYVLAHTDWLIGPLGAKAYWISLIIGLTFSAIASVIRLSLLLKRLQKNSSHELQGERGSM